MISKQLKMTYIQKSKLYTGNSIQHTGEKLVRDAEPWSIPKTKCCMVTALLYPQCYTTSGLELTRITVINWNLERVYDTFVIPERTIVDYNTR